MANGSFLTGEPSAITVDGDNTYNILDFGVNRSTENDKSYHSNYEYHMDGGKKRSEITMSIKVRPGKASADTTGQELFDDEAEGTRPGPVVVTLPGRGESTAQDCTFTALQPVIDSINMSNNDRILEADIELSLPSADGSTAPYTMVFS